MPVASRITALVLVLLAAVTLASAASGAASISGTIIDGISHKPVGGAKIEAFLDTNGSSGYPAAVSQTQRDGTFRLSALKAGAYRLHVVKMGYAMQELFGHLILGEPVNLVAASVEDMTKMACNSIVRPDATGDVYVVCAGK